MVVVVVAQRSGRPRETLRERGLHFVEGVRDVGKLDVELGYRTFEPLDAVKDLDLLRVRVVPDLERPRHRRYPAPELLLRVLEAVGHVVNRLIFLILFSEERNINIVLEILAVVGLLYSLAL